MGAKKKDEKYTIAVDFDGVIHQHTSPWIAPHIIQDSPIPGSLVWLWDMNQKFKVVIFTTRGRTWRGRRAVKKYLKLWSSPKQWASYEVFMGTHYKKFVGLEEIEVTDRKPAALIYIDDRAFRFSGTFPSSEQIHRAHPWKVTDEAKKHLTMPPGGSIL